MNEQEFIDAANNIIGSNYQIEIYDWKLIKQIINHIVVNNFHGEGRNIVDFIDRGSWDSISQLRFDDVNRQIEMIWHDGWIYHATIESIFVINANGSFYVLIKAYYQEKKTLNRKYSAGCRNHQISHFGDYMVEVRREFRDREDFIQIPNINCYTTCIMTRPSTGAVTSNGTSEKVMHFVNLLLANNKFLSLINEINAIDENDRDSLQEKGNTARRYFEYILMLINIKKQISLNGPYQKQMLGSLTPVINTLNPSTTLQRELNTAQNVLNACSHHGGVRIQKTSLISAINSIINLIKLM
ncbi:MULTISPECIES: hypothetical protein [Proteus]|uniref:hypothetical protein n=1 Tax=Proteus TaxID=583 RepID=UPI001376BBA3|nr:MULTISPECIES: hypothetical protein [Proteus]MBG3058136.1 hypothetical protein [Proteus mirabilis]MBI6309199.1 hypothetical protein [Proteus mirabilis]MBI6317994.1 hypothetical protein [Proteus mirabilis]MCL8615531.1 hypothetical protein [Proteus mirabilis]MCW9692020.1 hypothetical protein [Proteus mirabilis]